MPEEQISKHLRENSSWNTESKEVLIELMPNIPIEKKDEYAKRLVQHLTALDKIADSCCDHDFIITKLDLTLTKTLLKKCNFIFRVTEIPQGRLEQVKTSPKHSKKKATIKAKGSSIQPEKPQGGLPIVCVLDSGVNDIPQLHGHLITPIDGYRQFPTFTDDYRNQGHGTPIAYLTIFGENGTVPKARVVSYKIYSDHDKSVYPEGYKFAIAKYSNEYSQNRSRIFVSSISFLEYNDPVTAKIDRWIQENNICMVFASGNIDLNMVSNYALRRVHCSSYIHNHPVQDPAQAVNGIAIGSIAKKQSSNSMVKINVITVYNLWNHKWRLIRLPKT